MVQTLFLQCKVYSMYSMYAHCTVCGVNSALVILSSIYNDPLPGMSQNSESDPLPRPNVYMYRIAGNFRGSKYSWFSNTLVSSWFIYWWLLLAMR